MDFYGIVPAIKNEYIQSREEFWKETEEKGKQPQQIAYSKNPLFFSMLFTAKITGQKDKILFNFKPLGRPKTSINTYNRRYSSLKIYFEKNFNFFQKILAKAGQIVHNVLRVLVQLFR